MKKVMRRCRHCHCLFEVCHKVRKHEYCNKKKCQKARKRKWQREKMKNDPVYRKDQKAGQKDWAKNNPGYWKNYRRSHKKYTDRNREQQRRRNRLKRAKSGPDTNSGPIAKMDALSSDKPILSGKYRLVPIASNMIAKMDALIVEINAIPRDYAYCGP